MKRVRLWLPAVIWMGIIFLLSSRSRVSVSDSEAVNFYVFKSLHMIEYAVLYVLYFRAIRYTAVNRQDVYWYVVAYLMTICFAATDEIHQTFIPTRGGKASDVIIDAMGTVIAWNFIWIFLHKAPLRLKQSVSNLQIL